MTSLKFIFLELCLFHIFHQAQMFLSSTKQIVLPRTSLKLVDSRNFTTLIKLNCQGILAILVNEETLLLQRRGLCTSSLKGTIQSYVMTAHLKMVPCYVHSMQQCSMDSG